MLCCINHLKEEMEYDQASWFECYEKKSQVIFAESHSKGDFFVYTWCSMDIVGSA